MPLASGPPVLESKSGGHERIATGARASRWRPGDLARRASGGLLHLRHHLTEPVVVHFGRHLQQAVEVDAICAESVVVVVMVVLPGRRAGGGISRDSI
jgi:hypothetical protein